MTSSDKSSEPKSEGGPLNANVLPLLPLKMVNSVSMMDKEIIPANIVTPDKVINRRGSAFTPRIIQ